MAAAQRASAAATDDIDGVKQLASPAGMAKQSCCHKKKLRRGLWSPEEDEKLMNHIAKYGHGCWSSVPKLAGMYVCYYQYLHTATLILIEHQHTVQ